MADPTGDIYTATYSNVPVYELKISGGDHVMRRRSDDWVNATHILKIAGFDKPARTRILEREVQKGVHEKIQGGYGKYQGTWIPLGDGRLLAEKNGVIDRVAKIFDYVPGDKSPPPAPKHSTAASGRTKASKAAAANSAPRQAPKAPAPPAYQDAGEIYPDPTQSQQYYEQESQGRATPDTQSFMADDDFLPPMSQNSTASRKRKRDNEFVNHAAELEHTMYGDELLDYFITSGDDPERALLDPPMPPEGFDVNRPIDAQGHTALHWACAMGDVHVARDMLARGANPNIGAGSSEETPLMRAVLFTNNYDRQTFPKVVAALAGSIVERDRYGATVFHHIAQTLGSKSKWNCARYYCEVLINKMQEMGVNYVQTLLRSADSVGDTAVLIAVRHGCMKVASFLLNHCPEAGDQQNHNGDTANEYLRALKEKRELLDQPPSSPPSYSLGSRRLRRAAPTKRNVSQAASSVLSKIETASQEVSTKLASLYETEVKEKDIAIAEAKQALSDFETQRHQVRQESFQLTAQAEAVEKSSELHTEYQILLAEAQSLLEQKDHSVLQFDVRQRDQQANPQAFRSANPSALTHQEMQNALPWAIELHNQQQIRRRLIRDIADLTASAGTGERIGKHRKLVAIATGLKEDDLDAMSTEILDSLQATYSPDHPLTPQLVAQMQVV
ncbi:Transcription factor mbp1 [Lithohypha guttulata]|uniref:Cell pattern formation-associated protein stuA n=1 Tax=Lithohypha guttulata TaxID=1690604 RepID=A0AAN7T2K5_9EURO|nr:Transcription factor mbp1 [Lithohypha guttulata]KAK5097020.1 Transcription factor mbp1 [Lithohypha guttulata]